MQVANYDYKTLGWREAKLQASKLSTNDLSPEDKAKGLFDLISRSFIHTPSEYDIKLWDNWVMWLGGNIIDTRYLKSQDPDFLWKRGGGFCSQAAMIFVSKGRELGLKTRLIAMTGHVVAEVYLPGLGWRVVDPDMGIFWDHELESFEVNPSEEQVKHTLLTRGFSEEISKHFARIYVRPENHYRKDYPTSPNRLLLEKISNWLKWLIPFGFIGIPLVIRRNWFEVKFFRCMIRNPPYQL